MIRRWGAFAAPPCVALRAQRSWDGWVGGGVRYFVSSGGSTTLPTLLIARLLRGDDKGPAETGPPYANSGARYWDSTRHRERRPLRCCRIGCRAMQHELSIGL